MEEPRKDGGGDGGDEGAQQQQDTPAPVTTAAEKPLPATTASGSPPPTASVEATEPVKHKPCSDSSPHDIPVQNSSNDAGEMPAPTAMMPSQMSPAQPASQHQPSPRQMILKIPFKSSSFIGKQTASSSPAGQQYGDHGFAQGNIVGATSLLGDVGSGQTLDMASFGLANGLGSNTTFNNQGSSLNWQRQQPLQYPSHNFGATTQHMPNFPHVGVGGVKYPSTGPAAAAFRQSGANEPVSTEKVFHGLPNMNSFYNVSPRYIHGRRSLGHHIVSPQEMYYFSMQQKAFHSFPQSLPLQTDSARAKRKRRVVESDDEDEGELDKTKPSEHQAMQKSAEFVKPKQKVPETYTIYEDAEEGDSSDNESGLGSEVEEAGEEQEADEDDVEDDEEVVSEADQEGGDDCQDEEGAAGASDEDESEDDEPLANRLRTSASPNQKPSASSSDEVISWKIPEYEVQGLPASKKDGDPMAQISLPGCVREKIILSHDHAEQELHLFKEVFLPSHKALMKADDAPKVAILNFHHVCVMVLDAYYAHQTGDLEPSQGLSAGPRRTDSNLKWKDAREVDEDEIFFAAIDRWRTGLSRNSQSIHSLQSINSAESILKPAYAFIRGAQEFCDIALDIIHYIKQNGMFQEPPRERAPRSDKGVKRATPAVGRSSSNNNTAPPKKSKTPVSKAATSTRKTVASTGNSAKVGNATKKTSSGKDVGTKSNPHRPSTRKRAKTVAPRKEKLGISVTRRT